jgi:collagen type III alpha
MATLLDAPKPPSPAKIEEFVEKQLKAARRRLRVLDFFMTGLTLAVGSLLFFFAVLLVDRYVETPRGTGWAVLAGYVALAAGFIYVALFRPSRRQINPYFAARQVEQNVPNAKNSLVTWVDFEQDNHLPGSIRTAIGQKAARDLKQVDLNRAIENRKILWLGIAAGALALANVILAFLPPTRTELSLEEPRNGDITVFNNQDVAFRVHVAGRIPGANDADAVRLRMWYNPDDPETYEDRPMKQVEGERRKFALIVPAKQVRFGFHYKILAGKTQTPEYTVTCKIIPEINGCEVTYEYPAYLKRASETNNDANLLAPYGSTATIVVSTNREAKHGHIEIEGQARTLDGQLIEGRPDAIQFTVPIEKEGFYRIWFTTPEGDKNQDPARLRLGVIDPKPVFRTFDLDYEYPAYLRFKPMSVKDVREPEIEAPRGSKVIMTAKTSRGVQDAKIELNGQTITTEKVPDQPTWVRFKLPALDKDGTAKISFTPTTAEGPSAPRSISVRALIDQAPEVRITKPEEDEKQLPANGTLELEGLATDDHGVDHLTLRMKVINAEDRDLKSKPYRGGMSFLRKDDNSWPTRVEYKDFVKLSDLRMEKDPNWRVGPGTKIEYWLEAFDNCAVPEPNRGISKPKWIIVTAPAAKPEEQRKIEQQNKKDEADQQRHEKNQDQKNANEKRDVQQPPPKGAEQDKNEGTPERKTGEPGRNDMNPPKEGMPPDKPPAGDPDHEKQTDQVNEAIKKDEQDRKPGDVKPDTRPNPDAKVDPGETRPQPKSGPMDPPPAEDRKPKTDPNQPMMGEPGAGATKPGEIDKSKEEKSDNKPDGETKPGMSPEKSDAKPSFGGASSEASKDKPEPKDTPMPGMPPKEQVDKGTTHNKPKADPKEPKSGDKAEPSATKPDKDVASSDTKKPSGEPGPMGETPPQDVAGDKPRERPDAAGSKPEKKKDEVTDAGGSRKGPMNMDEAGGDKPSKPMGPMDEQARGGSKGGPRDPMDQGNEQGDLDRELGELDREINSKNPKVDDRKKRSVEDLMRDKEKREQVRKKLDELEKQADDDNDRLKKKKVEDMRAAAEKAAKDYDNEKPTPENVEKMANKLASNDPKERKEGEQRAKDWDKDPQTREEMKQKVDELKKKDRNTGEKAEDAMKKAEQVRNQSATPDQKLDEKQLKDIAKDLNGMDEKAKADAKEKLEKMMQDPKTAKEAKEKLEQMANNATDPKQKVDLKNAAKEAGKMADDLAMKDPPMPKNGDVDPKALEDAAKKLASGDPKEKKEAMDKLKEMAKDPKAAKEMQDKLKDMAQDAKTPEDKKAMEDAAKAAQEIAKDMGKQETPKLNPDDVKDLAKKLASDDPKAKEEAQKKMQEMMKDPKAKEEARKMLEEMAKNMKNSPEDQKAIEDAIKEMAKNQPPKMDPKDLADLAKEFDKMDPKAKEELKKKFEEEMKDPKKREELKKMAEEMAKNSTPEQKKQFNDMLKQLGGPDYIDDGKPDPADPRNKLKAAELILEKFKNDKIGPKLDWTDEQIAKWVKDQEAVIEALRNQVQKGDWGPDRNRNTPTRGGIVKPDLVGKDGKDGNVGGKYAPPAGYVDPYKKLLGGAAEPKK